MISLKVISVLRYRIIRYGSILGDRSSMKKHNFLSPMHKATRQIGLHFERAADSNLSPQEGHLLTYLRVYAPSPIGDLVRIFGVKASTMTSMLDRLEALALTERTVN